MQRTLIKGATIITMDVLGDLPRGDVLVTGDTLTEIAPVIHADDVKVVDAAGFIIIPGLVNAHMHTWQSALRGLAANWTLLEYFQKMHAGLATVFEPADMHIATLVGALNQLNRGTTTLADWCFRRSEWQVPCPSEFAPAARAGALGRTCPSQPRTQEWLLMTSSASYRRRGNAAIAASF